MGGNCCPERKPCRDIEAFDKACVEKDVTTLVRLLKSLEPVEPFEHRLHPWAEDPTTVGALAVVQIVMLVQRARTDETLGNVQEQVRDAGGLQDLVGFLNSGEMDRIQNALVALNLFASTNDQKDIDVELNAKIIYKAGAMPLLYGHLNSKSNELSAAVATLLNHICSKIDEAKKEFFNSGGIGLLIGLMSADLPLDELLALTVNLHDLVEDGDGEVVREFANAALQAGAKKALEDIHMKATKSNNQQLQQEALDAQAALASTATEERELCALQQASPASGDVSKACMTTETQESVDCWRELHSTSLASGDESKASTCALQKASVPAERATGKTEKENEAFEKESGDEKQEFVHQLFAPQEKSATGNEELVEHSCSLWNGSAHGDETSPASKATEKRAKENEELVQ